MEDTYGTARISIKYGELPTCEFKISAAYREEIKKIFGVDLGYRADGTFDIKKEFSKCDINNLIGLYQSDFIHQNSNNDKDGDRLNTNSMEIESALSVPREYSVFIEYCAPKDPTFIAQTTTAKTPKNLFESIVFGLRGLISQSA